MRIFKSVLISLVILLSLSIGAMAADLTTPTKYLGPDETTPNIPPLDEIIGPTNGGGSQTTNPKTTTTLIPEPESTGGSWYWGTTR